MELPVKKPRREGERVGRLASAGWGYTLETNIGMGYVRNKAAVDRAFLESGACELEVNGEHISCELHLDIQYDPEIRKLECQIAVIPAKAGIHYSGYAGPNRKRPRGFLLGEHDGLRLEAAPTASDR